MTSHDALLPSSARPMLLEVSVLVLTALGTAWLFLFPPTRKSPPGPTDFERLLNDAYRHFRSRKYQDALDTLQYLLGMSRGSLQPRQMALIARNIGLCYETLQQPESAMPYHEWRLEVARELQDPRLEAPALEHMGNCKRDCGDVPGAIALHKQARKVRWSTALWRVGAGAGAIAWQGHPAQLAPFGADGERGGGGGGGAAWSAGATSPPPPSSFWAT